MYNVIDCYVMKNGWVWNIFLWNCIGIGYCYLFRFVSKDDVEVEFREYLGECGKDVKIFYIDIGYGKCICVWVNNCVGIGFFYGFIEFLEFIGLLIIYENIENLVYFINQRDGYVMQVERDGFNYICDYQIDFFFDFVVMYYVYFMRIDILYWKWCI